MLRYSWNTAKFDAKRKSINQSIEQQLFYNQDYQRRPPYLNSAQRCTLSIQVYSNLSMVSLFFIMIQMIVGYGKGNSV